MFPYYNFYCKFPLLDSLYYIFNYTFSLVKKFSLSRYCQNQFQFLISLISPIQLTYMPKNDRADEKTKKMAANCLPSVFSRERTF
jgi:hypothetical protein